MRNHATHARFWLAFSLFLVTIPSTIDAAPPSGHQPEVAVREATRIDWLFAVSNQSPASPPEGWLKGYDSTRQSFELYVPARRPRETAPGLVLFISPGERGTGLSAFRELCDANNLLFASPHAAGNNVDTRQRIRIVLDVLDQLRRDYQVDPDRTYIGGFSGGGRMACAIGFALPEYFGGVLPVCAAGDLREEAWLRQRVRERMSVAHVTGESDFNRGEVERFRGPMLAAVGVRSKVWVAPSTGHAIPGPAFMTQAVQWLDESLPQRRKLAKERPASRIAADASPTREQWAQQLLSEGKDRMRNATTRYSGLMQVKGTFERWPDLRTAEEAKNVLLQVEQSADKAWEEEDIAEQRRFLIARAKCLSDYATGPLPPQYQRQRPDMAQAAIELWELVISDGQDAAAAAEGKRRLTELAKLLTDEDK